MPNWLPNEPGDDSYHYFSPDLMRATHRSYIIPCTSTFHGSSHSSYVGYKKGEERLNVTIHNSLGVAGTDRLV